MPVPDQYGFFIDPSRCIGCKACVQACSECDTHKGLPMIHLEYIDRALLDADDADGVHALRSPTCAEVCPADAIKKGEDGVVRMPSRPAAWAATTACWPVRSACPRWSANTT